MLINFFHACWIMADSSRQHLSSFWLDSSTCWAIPAQYQPAFSVLSLTENIWGFVTRTLRIFQTTDNFKLKHSINLILSWVMYILYTIYFKVMEQPAKFQYSFLMSFLCRVQYLSKLMLLFLSLSLTSNFRLVNVLTNLLVFFFNHYSFCKWPVYLLCLLFCCFKSAVWWFN